MKLRQPLNIKIKSKTKHKIKNPAPVTQAMILGALVDCLVTQSDLFDSQFAIRPGEYSSYRTLDSKLWKNEIELQGLTAITQDDYDSARRITDAINMHPEAGEILGGPGEGQCAVEWTDDRHPVLCRGLIDWLRLDGGFVELKTTTAEDWDGFSRRAYNFKYHGQVAFYNKGLEMVGRSNLGNTRIIVVMQSPPHLVQCFQPSFRFMDAGNRLVDRMIDAWTKWSSVSGDWVEYPSQTPILDLPEWAYKEVVL